MAVESQVIVREQAPVPQEIPENMASTIAVIGAFDSEITDLTLCNSAREAHQKFGTMGTEGDFKGTDAIDGLFTGASSLLVVNITTWNGSTPETTITQAKLGAALNKLHNESFGMLFVADELTDALHEIKTAWLDAEFESHYAHGEVVQLQKSTVAAYETSIGKFNKQIYFPVIQQYTVDGVTLSLNRSAAYMAGYIASLSVDTSLTNQIIPGVTAATPEYYTATGEMGAALLNLNIPFLKCRNRRLQTFYCVNSMLPDGYDLYINRTRDTVLNNITVETALGKKNNSATENSIITIMEGLKQHYIDDLKLLADLSYHVENCDNNTKCKRVIIESMTFDDVLDTIYIDYSIKVQ